MSISLVPLHSRPSFHQLMAPLCITSESHKTISRLARCDTDNIPNPNAMAQHQRRNVDAVFLH